MYKRQDFKRVLDKARVAGVKMIQNRVGEGIIETRVNVCQESESMENDERVWENRAKIFFNEGGVVGGPQRQELWAVIERFRGVFAELPEMCIRDRYTST